MNVIFNDVYGIKSFSVNNFFNNVIVYKNDNVLYTLLLLLLNTP